MAKWKKTSHKLKANHGWRCSPDHKLIVLGRGLMQFEYPMDWIVIPQETSIKIHEKTPPYDDIVLEVSVMPLPEHDWSSFSLEDHLQDSMLQRGGTVISGEEIHIVPRNDMKIVWGEYRSIEEDPKDKSLREAVWRHAFCLENNTFALLTYGFWTDAQVKADAVWEPLLKSIIMNRIVDDPTRGPKFH